MRHRCKKTFRWHTIGFALPRTQREAAKDDGKVKGGETSSPSQQPLVLPFYNAIETAEERSGLFCGQKLLIYLLNIAFSLGFSVQTLTLLAVVVSCAENVTTSSLR